MANTITTAHLGQKPIKNIDPLRKPGRGILEIRIRTVNFDSYAALAHTDTYQMIEIKPGETIICAGVNVLTAATAGATIDVGLNTSDNFLDGIAANDITLPAVTDGFSGGSEFITQVAATSSSDTIDAKEKSGAQTLAGCKAQIWALIARLGPTD